MKSLLYSLMAVLIFNNSALAGSTGGDKHSELDGYTKTDLQVDCISKKAIRSFKILSSEAILFKMRNGDFVLNSLEKKCPSLPTSGRIENRRKDAFCSNGQFYASHITLNQHYAKSICNLGGFEIYQK